MKFEDIKIGNHYKLLGGDKVFKCVKKSSTEDANNLSQYVHAEEGGYYYLEEIQCEADEFIHARELYAEAVATNLAYGTFDEMALPARTHWVALAATLRAQGWNP